MKAVNKKTKIESYVFNIILFVILLIYTASLLVTLLWGFFTSVKSEGDFIMNVIGLPEKWMFKNYLTAFANMSVSVSLPGGGFREVSYVMSLGYSVLYAGGSALAGTFIVCITSYAVSKYKFKFSAFLYGVVLFVMLVPIVGSMPSSIQISKALGLYDTVHGMWIMKAYFPGLYFLIYYATFKSLSWEYAESAFVDGASHTRVMFTIMLPLTKTTFSTILLLNFVACWNDYQTPMIYMPSKPTAAYAVYLYKNSTSQVISGLPMQIAGCFILLLPILLIYIVFRNKFVGNLTVGGIKG